MAFVRAKGPDGAEFTIDESAVEALGASVVNKPAVDINGRPLGDKPRTEKAPASAASTTKNKEA